MNIFAKFCVKNAKNSENEILEISEKKKKTIGHIEKSLQQFFHLRLIIKQEKPQT